MRVKRAWYVLGLTFEKNAPFKKLRVQIASEDLLKKVCDEFKDVTQVTFERETHNERWSTIKKMAEIYQTKGTNNPSSCLWKVEMAIPE